MADEIAKPPGRPMRYPYTFSAKLAQFPLKWMIANQPLWKYYCFGLLVSFPVFWKIDRMGKKNC